MPVKIMDGNSEMDSSEWTKKLAAVFGSWQKLNLFDTCHTPYQLQEEFPLLVELFQKQDLSVVTHSLSEVFGGDGGGLALLSSDELLCLLPGAVICAVSLEEPVFCNTLLRRLMDDSDLETKLVKCLQRLPQTQQRSLIEGLQECCRIGWEDTRRKTNCLSWVQKLGKYNGLID